MDCKVHKYNIVKTSQGNIFKLLKLSKRNSSNKELYISEVKRNNKKGWNLHTKHTCLIFLIEGAVKFKVYKNKKNSKIKFFNLSLKRNNILEIPPQHWFSFEKRKILKDCGHELKKGAFGASIVGLAALPQSARARMLLYKLQTHCLGR